MQIRYDDSGDILYVTLSGKPGADHASTGVTVNVDASGAQVIEIMLIEAREKGFWPPNDKDRLASIRELSRP